MGSLYQPSAIRLWWRRKSFHVRRLPFLWCLFLFLLILYLIVIIPNPYSSVYERIPIKQIVEWNRITELLQVKEKILRTDSLSYQVKIIRQGKKDISSSKSILILLYTTIFLKERYCPASINEIFGHTCPSKKRCEWTCDRQKLRQADAIIFHAYDVQYYHAQIPNRSQTKSSSIWILWSDEPYTMIDYILFKSYQFNWTISYKLNSEVSIGTYGLFIKRKSPWSNEEYNQWIVKQFSQRLNGALWFVSNCDARQRLKYYDMLRQEINTTVEGYGRCVDSYPMHFCRADSQCERDYMSKFKYYLSFESTTCRDYITEKFYKSLYYGLIPIVYGPERNDYNSLVPHNSFIHIEDFYNDMNKLANYLEKIHLNFTLYSMYHRWRKTYEVIIDGRAVERIRLCELCERLSKTRRDDVTYYEDIDEFFHEKC